MDTGQKKAIIIGAGPAGLTAAYELLKRTGIKPIIIEKSEFIGGISKTINYKGNRIDLGGHRFFSKSRLIMDWWNNIFPVQNESLDPEKEDNIMMVRKRKSRIYYYGKFFDYPVTLNGDALKKLGLLKTIKIGASYLKSVIFPIKKEGNMEDFFINRFGRELYSTFFKSYTEKVWGLPCNKISAEWGFQRIKGLSIKKAAAHFFKGFFLKRKNDIFQEKTETSLIESFLYPKYGPGHLWEQVAKKIKEKGGVIINNHKVLKINFKGGYQIKSIEAINNQIKNTVVIEGDYFFSSMPIKELVNSLQKKIPKEIKIISNGLFYRDFIMVGMLLNKLKITDKNDELIKDTWIYIQEPNVSLGRIQIFNNWSPYLLSDSSKVWIGLEYYCNATDDLWNKPNGEIVSLATQELDRIGIIDQKELIDSTVIRTPKAYPTYFGAYKEFPKLKDYLNKIENLFLIGRNGMHRYNNMDHSMLTAITAVDNIIKGNKDKSNIWQINTEDEYHEMRLN